ncbi:hypothetical protein RRG08_048957 [Elysia crispata]|uniref:Uncharacterized protein n=1 Tax=Elysia crispata TaxID=231223 RepID=A0AAE0YCT2_9GAST|nr:hypothetical protein RRG08_048957 [Elysia crispata]
MVFLVGELALESYQARRQGRVRRSPGLRNPDVASVTKALNRNEEQISSFWISANVWTELDGCRVEFHSKPVHDSPKINNTTVCHLKQFAVSCCGRYVLSTDRGEADTKIP